MLPNIMLHTLHYSSYMYMYILHSLSSTASLCNTCITSHFKLCHFIYIPYITHLICIYCTRYHLLHLAYAVLYHHSLISLCTYSLSLYTCVYGSSFGIVRLDYSLIITALSELESQAFRYTRINIC